jgi:hypothetical protein
MRKVTFPKKEALQKTLIYTTETCGACLLELTDSLTIANHSTTALNKEQTSEYIAALPCCSHLFHSSCIVAWTEQENSCPLCKQRFRLLGKYHPITGALVEKVNVMEKDFEEAEDYYDHEVDVCEECKVPIAEGEGTIVCDGMERTCNRLFHLNCVRLKNLPRGDWFCDDCEGHERGRIDGLRHERGMRARRGKQAAAAGDEARGYGGKEASERERGRTVSLAATTATPSYVSEPSAASRKRATPSFELPSYETRNKRLRVSEIPDSARATKSSPLPRMFAVAAAADRVIETLHEIAPNVEKRKSVLEEIREKRLARIAAAATVKPQTSFAQAKSSKITVSYQQDFLFG